MIWQLCVIQRFAVRIVSNNSFASKGNHKQSHVITNKKFPLNKSLIQCYVVNIKSFTDNIVTYTICM